MRVTEVSTLTEFQRILNKADANRLIIVDFYATWCGPCRQISPYYEQLSRNFDHATFLKVNCDEARDIVTAYRISAMPTFLFFKNKIQVELVRGANKTALENAIANHYSPVPANPNAASEEEKSFLEQFVKHTELRQNYMDEVYKALARSVMPEDLIEKVEEGKADEKELIKELLEWFKTKFFTWFDKPTCPKCTLKCTTEGLAGTPTKEEWKDGANRVEVYICDGCNTEMRFPRYNNPAKLLQTRTGRCGEWANCFALLLSAINIEVRFVLDITDHVWNEVFIKSENRWIHVDPCENAMDQPLLYTRGWNKKLKYCIAYGNDHVADVTWRYVYDSRDAAKQRYEVRPNVFENFLFKLNARQMEGQTETRKKALALRRMCELFQMIDQEKKNQAIGWEKLGDNMGGRISGSEEWRRARGETGSRSTKNYQKPLGRQIKLDIKPEQNYVELLYDINRDSYSIAPESGFISQAFHCVNVKRVVEHDWKQVYLCREDGFRDGEISWEFDYKSLAATRPIDKVEIEVNGVTSFETGHAVAVVCFGLSCVRVPSNGKLTLQAEESAGKLKITALLTGGEGNIAFQQAQLFRTDIKEEGSTESLKVKFWFK